MDTHRSPLRIGLIGCGTIAYWAHLRSLQRMSSAVLVAAADPDPAARARFATRTRVPLLERAEDLLQREDVEAVIIAAPTHLHAGLAVAAAQAGKHFYLEKPLAMDAAGARAVRSALAPDGIIATVGFNRRFHPVHVEARRLLASGCIGRVRAVQSVFCEPVDPGGLPAWKRQRPTGGGVLLDLGSHHFDLVRWFLKDEVATVEAGVSSEHSEGDVAGVNLILRGGVGVQSHFSFGAGPADVFEFIGEKGTLRVDRHQAAPELRRQQTRGYGIRRVGLTRNLGDVARHLEHWLRPGLDPSYRLALSAFVDRVRGVANDSAILADGAASLATVLAAEAAAVSGDRVGVEPL